MEALELGLHTGACCLCDLTCNAAVESWSVSSRRQDLFELSSLHAQGSRCLPLYEHMNDLASPDEANVPVDLPLVRSDASACKLLT